MIKVFRVSCLGTMGRWDDSDWLRVDEMSPERQLELRPIKERYPEVAEAYGVWLEDLALAHALNSLVEAGYTIISVMLRCDLGGGAAWQVVTSS